MVAQQPLLGLHIMVTRPAHQAVRLCELISAAGGVPVPVPVLSIEEAEDLNPARDLVARIKEFDIIIFVSTNAVEKGMALIHQHADLPPHIKLAAIGQRSALDLHRLGVKNTIKPTPPYNSESLLACRELQSVKDKYILIFRGRDGRERLAETLRERGARVAYAEVYRRTMPDAKHVTQLAQIEEIDIVVVTSQDGLRNLMKMATMAGRDQWILTKPLAVISRRVAHLARELGFSHPGLVAEEASDEALVKAIAVWQHKRQAAQ